MNKASLKIIYKLSSEDKKLKSLVSAAQNEPRNPSAWKALGLSLANLNYHSLAIECYDEGLEINEKEPNLWYSKGIANGNLADFGAAVYCFDRTLLLKPRLVEALFYKGIALHELSKYEEAIRCYDRAMNIKPRFILPLSFKGLALKEQGGYNEAIRCYDRYLRKYPKDVLTLEFKGLTLDDNGHQGTQNNFEKAHEDAIECFNKALKSQANNVRVLYRKAISLGHINRYTEAIICYDAALKIKPNFIEAMNSKGHIYYLEGEYSKAIESFDQALALDQYSSESWTNKANALIGMGRLKEAMACFEKAIKIDSKDTSALVGLGGLLTQMSKFVDAEGYFKKALQINPSHLDALKNLGLLYSDKLFRFDDALKIAHKLSGLQPDVATKTIVVENLIKVKNYDLARQRALAILPETTTDTTYQFLNRFFVACTYYLQGNKPAGHECISQLLKMYRAMSKDIKMEGAWSFAGLKKVIDGSGLEPSVRELVRLTMELMQGKGNRERAMTEIEGKLAQSGGRLSEAIDIQTVDKGIKSALETLLMIADYEYQRYGQDTKKSNPDSLPVDLKNKLRGIMEAYEKFLSLSRDLPINVDLNISEELDLINLLMTEGKYDNALSLCDQILRVQPRNIRALNYRGIILHRSRKPKDAIKAYDEVISIEPDNLYALVNKGLALDSLNRQDKHKEAEDLYIRATRITLAQVDSDSLVNKGLAFHKLHDHDKARMYYNKALDINPNDLHALVNMGIDLDLEKNHKEAISYYNKALEINPKNLNALYNKAVSYCKLGKLDESIEQVQQVLALHPRCIEDIKEDSAFSRLRRYIPFKKLIPSLTH